MVQKQQKSAVAKDKKSLSGSCGILDSNKLAPLIAENPLRLIKNAVKRTLGHIKNVVKSNDYEGFCRIDLSICTFWN